MKRLIILTAAVLMLGSCCCGNEEKQSEASATGVAGPVVPSVARMRSSNSLMSTAGL